MNSHSILLTLPCLQYVTLHLFHIHTMSQTYFPLIKCHAHKYVQTFLASFLLLNLWPQLFVSIPVLEVVVNMLLHGFFLTLQLQLTQVA